MRLLHLIAPILYALSCILIMECHQRPPIIKAPTESSFWKTATLDTTDVVVSEGTLTDIGPHLHRRRRRHPDTLEYTLSCSDTLDWTRHNVRTYIADGDTFRVFGLDSVQIIKPHHTLTYLQ